MAWLLGFCGACGSARAVPWSVYFSPDGGCTAAIVAELAKATNSVQVQAYSFTSVDLARALLAAHKRGVLVRVVLDKSQRSTKYSSADFLLHAGIETWIDDRHAIAHNKVMIIDKAVVITGSFNFTKAAESQNAENLLILRDRALADRYLENWNLHQAHAVRYEGRD